MIRASTLRSAIATVFLSTVSLGADDHRLTPEEERQGWILLFDGKSTRGWMTPSGTPIADSHVQDGALNPHPCNYMLVHEAMRDDFRLALDFKIAPGTNSGIFIRTLPLEPRPGLDVGYNGIEVAIDDTTGSGLHDTGAIYDLSPPARQAMRPAGEWNHIIVTCDRNRVEVELNGERVNRIDLDQWTRPHRRPDGTEHKFDTAYKHHPRRGYIGLQDHGGDVWFRNIRLLPLDATTRGSAQQRVPILGWHSIPEGELSIERFRELADMGLTHSLMSYGPEANLRALDLALEAGVALFVGDRRFHDRGAALAEAVASYRDHPALAGYTLRDEPSLDAFRDLAATRDAIARHDTGHWSYVNLLPTYASTEQLGSATYAEHVRRFLVEFRPEVLSFDHYPIVAGPDGERLRGDYYENLETIRAAALEFDVPFWAFALTCPHSPYPTPTLAHVRLQTWSDFAYGAKGLQYFTYWTPRPGTWDFHDAPIRLDGTRSPTWDLLQSFNRDVQACAEIIVASRVVGVWHTEPLPAGTRPIDAASPFVGIAGAPALVGLHVLPDGRRHALVVHRAIAGEARRVELALAPWVERASLAHDVAGVSDLAATENRASLTLEPGAGAFLRLHTGDDE